MVDREETPYNPLDKRNLAESVAEAMLARPLESLPPPASFIGAGIYALYYVGNFEPYKRLSKLNKEAMERDPSLMVPIYVGIARPEGARTGLTSLESTTSKALYGRLGDHSRKIRTVENLKIEDFYCRYLVVDDIWTPLGETLLISTYYPLWNRRLAGFGNNAPGKGRELQKNSSWHIMHPGKNWSTRLQASKIKTVDLEKEVKEHWEKHLVEFEDRLKAEKLGRSKKS
jgi:hypothetical protein